jgi:thiamine biosynthesis lipoprotein
MTGMKTNPAYSRRRFLLGTAGACAAVDAGVWQSSRRRNDRETVRRTSHALGSAVTMTVWHRSRAAGESALDAAFAELERVEEVMSIYRPGSEISRLNRDGVLEAPDPRLVTVLESAAGLAARTGGAFDVTVQPLWDLYREAKEQGCLPDEAAVREARARVDWRRVEVTPERIRLAGDGTAITLNGIAQGFACDAALATLRGSDVSHALIDTGEMGALGGKPDGEAWKVGIQHPRLSDAFISLARLEDRCLATSGDYQTRFSAGFAHHHLFDPHTGHSPSELASVSVAAPSAMDADALSTAVFVLGAERGLALLRDLPGTDALLVLKDGRVVATDGFPAEA